MSKPLILWFGTRLVSGRLFGLPPLRGRLASPSFRVVAYDAITRVKRDKVTKAMAEISIK
ncbi:MAG TPA: hypothetical protein DCL48_00110 [Alphaproteobacteria bacterium]|nr:hypothetical protein [Alphaproteobacteria bacterium]